MKNLETIYFPSVAENIDSDPPRIFDALQEAISKLSPFWEIKHFVAVNPFMGLQQHNFADALQYMSAAIGDHLLPDRAYFRKQYESGEIQKQDIQFAIDKTKIQQSSGSILNLDPQQAIDFLNDGLMKKQSQFFSLSDLYDHFNNTQITQTVVREISKWMAAYFDESQATWKMPNRNKRFYQAWLPLVKLDKTLDRKGIDFTTIVRQMPSDPKEVIKLLAGDLTKKVGLNSNELTNYFFRLIISVKGWASYLKKFEFEQLRDEKHKDGGQESMLIDLIAVRMIYDIIFLDWAPSLDRFKQSLADPDFKQLDYSYIWLLSAENAYRRKLLSKIQTTKSAKKALPVAQMVFCIDTRSEMIRRHIESTIPEVQTIGFAGFFGLPINLKGLGHSEVKSLCPVLLKPEIEVHEKAQDQTLEDRTLRAASLVKMRKLIQSAGNSCFSFVETVGLSYFFKLIQKSSGLSKPDKDLMPIDPKLKNQENILYDLNSVSLKQKIDLASSVIKNMGLNKSFAPFVFLIGHQSESSNNPYGSALDCGACAGQSGKSNAEILARILNDDQVKSGLKEKYGIEIPFFTVFLAGIHNTTRDKIDISFKPDMACQQGQSLEKILKKIKIAQENCQKERIKETHFKITKTVDEEPHEFLKRKANDWSELRPEWGLAGNASFIVGNRYKTRCINLESRAFLHDYNHVQDEDGSILELILTKPMVVTNWINMQYYASTVDSNNFGSGNKVLHNVLGHVGCIQGNSSDLLIGLNEQSVKYDGEYVHHPLRLQVVVETTKERLETILHKNSFIKDLIHNEWIQLILMDPFYGKFYLYEGDGLLSFDEFMKGGMSDDFNPTNFK